MKGLVEKTETRAVFLQVKHGSLCQESKVPREGFEPIEVQNPRTYETFTKYVKRYSAVEAFIDKIEWKDTGDKYETQFMSWLIYLNADESKCVLELPFNSRPSTRFMKLAENIDFTKPVEFRVWHDTREDKTAFFVGQGQDASGKSTAVPQKYTRDQPGNCPEPTKNRLGKWNYDAQTEFLHEQMMNVVRPKVEAALAKREFQSPQNNEEPPPFDASEPEFIDDEDPSF